MSNWISVNDRLPEEQGMECWVAIKGHKEATIDIWEDDRGEPGLWAAGQPFTHSGWYTNCGAEITHWMPLTYPDMPKEGDFK